jgi:flagellar biogenesis protein FliO
VLFIVLGIVGGLLLVGVLIFVLRRWLMKKQSKKVQTLLESEDTAYHPATDADEQQ